MSKLVTIYGGSGFVGRYIARRMAKQGWRVRVAVRRPNEAMFVKPYGVVGQVEPVLCNVRDDASVAAVMQGADAVVNCVGILAESGKNSFDAVQTEGAERIARTAAELGVGHMVHISAIGADAESDSDYARTKAEGEAAVLQHMPNAMILRPSIMFGTEDAFFNRFASMSRMSPVLPVIGAETKFQPVFVDDVAAAAERGVLDGISGVFELAPIAASYINDLARMSEAEVDLLSPLHKLPASGIPVHVLIGADEPEAFQIQSKVLRDEWSRHLPKLSYCKAAGRDHFDVLEELATPTSATVRAIQDMV